MAEHDYARRVVLNRRPLPLLSQTALAFLVLVALFGCSMSYSDLPREPKDKIGARSECNL